MKFWQDLRRRRIFRLVGLYVVGAWIVIQVADISFPAWAETIKAADAEHDFRAEVEQLLLN